MRTVILLGFNLVALAIVQSVGIYAVDVSDRTAGIYAVIVLFCMLFDALEFIKNMCR
jgi:hypothetical protein